MINSIAPYRPSIPMETLGIGIDVGGTLILPPGGRVFYVRGTAGALLTYADDQFDVYRSTFQGQVFPSVATALAKCVSGRGDRIIVLEGHTENIAAADAWPFVAGVKIIGIGSGDRRPTFTFTVATATLLVDVAGVCISNCRFLCAGPAGTTALTVAAPFTVSAADCVFAYNKFEVGIDADQIAAALFTTTAAADNLVIYDNDVTSAAAAAAVTTLFSFVGADGLKFVNNRCRAGFSGAATGLLKFLTTASTNVYIAGNTLHQWTATSTGGIDMSADLANTGVIIANNFITEDTANTGIVPIVQHANSLCRLFGKNACSNEKATRGVELGTEAG